LGRAGLGQEAGEAGAEAQGSQVHAYFEELSVGGLGLSALVDVIPGHTDGPAVDLRDGLPRRRPEHLETAAAAAAHPPVDRRRGAGAGVGELGDQQDVAVEVAVGVKKPVEWVPVKAFFLPDVRPIWLTKNQKPMVESPLLS